MFKVKDKWYYKFDNEEVPIYTVYAVRDYESNYGSNDCYSEDVVEFLIFRYDKWIWVDAKNYIPVESESNE